MSLGAAVWFELEILQVAISVFVFVMLALYALAAYGEPLGAVAKRPVSLWISLPWDMGCVWALANHGRTLTATAFALCTLLSEVYHRRAHSRVQKS